MFPTLTLVKALKFFCFQRSGCVAKVNGFSLLANCSSEFKVPGKRTTVEVQVPMLLPHEVFHELHKAGSLQAGLFGKKYVCKTILF